VVNAAARIITGTR